MSLINVSQRTQNLNEIIPLLQTTELKIYWAILLTLYFLSVVGMDSRLSTLAGWILLIALGLWRKLED